MDKILICELKSAEKRGVFSAEEDPVRSCGSCLRLDPDWLIGCLQLDIVPEYSMNECVCARVCARGWRLILSVSVGVQRFALVAACHTEL